MRRAKTAWGTTVVLALWTVCAAAQDGSSSSVFSPYTMYGIGDLSVGGNVANRLMGGAGVAVRRADQFNYLNPASLSAIPQKSAIFNFGGDGINTYLSSATAKTSYNSFNLHDVGFAVPLYKGIGFGVSLTPYSAVGYSTAVVNNTPSVVENIGRAVYTYDGQGGISQLTAHFGIQVARGFSLGVAGHFNFGMLNRTYDAEIFPLLNTTTYRSITSSDDLTVSQFSATLGAQYSVRVGAEAALMFGVTYSPRIKASAERSSLSTTYNNTNYVTDTVFSVREQTPLAMPEKFAVGLYYVNRYVGIALDYSYQDWRGAFEQPAGTPMMLSTQHDVRFGVHYTPDRYSIRSAFSRWTYKVGFRYTNPYMRRIDSPTDQYNVSAGVDIPLKVRSYSTVSVGLEYGYRAPRSVATPQRVVEQSLRVFVGFSLFGDDMWFQKRKFN